MALDEHSVAFIVSSSALYTLPRNKLLDSLCPQTSLVYNVINAYDGVADDGTYHSDVDASYVFMKGGSWDFIGQIWASLLGDTVFSHAFFLQDTMEVEPGFVEYVLTHTNPAVDVTAVYGGMCNLMCCRMEYVRSRRDFLLRMRNCSKKDSIDHEGALFKTALPLQRAAYDIQLIENRSPVFPYGSDVPRITEYYTPIGITKYKANYGQTREGTYHVKP